MERNLELTIRMDNDHVEIDVYEPESGGVFSNRRSAELRRAS